jgi:hypothetical protein
MKSIVNTRTHEFLRAFNLGQGSYTEHGDFTPINDSDLADYTNNGLTVDDGPAATDTLALFALILSVGSMFGYVANSSNLATPGSRMMVYVQQATQWPLFIAWLLHDAVMTKWTGNILTNALWWSFLGPFLGNWVGILY